MYMQEGKVDTVHTMKAYRVSRGTVPLILNLHTRWVWEVNFIPWPLYSLYLLNRRLGGPHSQSGLFGKDKISCSCQDLHPGPSSLQLVVTLTTLFQLQ